MYLSVIFVLVDYELKDNVYCDPGTQFATNLVDAEQACTLNEECTMFYDKCDEGNDFYFCTDAIFKTSACNTLLYTKPTEGKHVQFQ